MISNSLEALQHQPVVSKLALVRLQQLLKTLTQQVAAVEAEPLALLERRTALCAGNDATVLDSGHWAQNGGAAVALCRRFYALR
jgi:hypothetical protein